MEVAATPEEKVRQQLLSVMMKQLGYPKELLAVEKKLSELPHLKREKGLPNRRADLLCFAPHIHSDYPLYPLLLIECKEGSVGAVGKQQALGYNHYVKAPYVAVAGLNQIELIYPIELSFLPTYADLLEKIPLCR